MKIIAYKASAGTWLDKLIAWLDGSQYSHVELVLGQDKTHYITTGCHWGRGGVSVGYIRINPLEWDEFVTPDVVSEAMESTALMARDRGYAIHKLPRTKWRWWPTFGRGFVCSTYLAWLLGFNDPDSYGVKDFIQTIGVSK